MNMVWHDNICMQPIEPGRVPIPNGPFDQRGDPGKAEVQRAAPSRIEQPIHGDEGLSGSALRRECTIHR